MWAFIVIEEIIMLQNKYICRFCQFVLGFFIASFIINLFLRLVPVWDPDLDVDYDLFDIC